MLTTNLSCLQNVWQNHNVCTDEEVEELECEYEDGRGGAVAERDEGRVRGQDGDRTVEHCVDSDGPPGHEDAGEREVGVLHPRLRLFEPHSVDPAYDVRWKRWKMRDYTGPS